MQRVLADEWLKQVARFGGATSVHEVLRSYYLIHAIQTGMIFWLLLCSCLTSAVATDTTESMFVRKVRVRAACGKFASLVSNDVERPAARDENGKRKMMIFSTQPATVSFTKTPPVVIFSMLLLLQP